MIYALSKCHLSNKILYLNILISLVELIFSHGNIVLSLRFNAKMYFTFLNK